MCEDGDEIPPLMAHIFHYIFPHQFSAAGIAARSDTSTFLTGKKTSHNINLSELTIWWNNWRWLGDFKNAWKKGKQMSISTNLIFHSMLQFSQTTNEWRAFCRPQPLAEFHCVPWFEFDCVPSAIFSEKKVLTGTLTIGLVLRFVDELRPFYELCPF